MSAAVDADAARVASAANLSRSTDTSATTPTGPQRGSFMCGQQGSQAIARRLQPLACPRLPGAIGQGEPERVTRRSGDRPRPEGFTQGIQQGLRGTDETGPSTGEAEELADRPQHDQPIAIGDVAQAALGRRVDERFIDDEPAVSRGKRRLQRQQRRAIEQVAGRIVGMDQHDHVESMRLREQFRCRQRFDRVSVRAP